MVRPAQDEFEATTENAALVELLRRRIEAEGTITFHDFMETVLYHPQLGYYATRQPMGRQGDYLTSPQLHSISGALVPTQLAQFWELMGQPDIDGALVGGASLEADSFARIAAFGVAAN